MSTYFEKFDKVAYRFNEDSDFYLMSDITRNVRFGKEFLRSINVYEIYHINDGDTPERISEKVYGSPHYHWVILLMNEIEDWVTAFPLTYNELNDYIEEKYSALAGDDFASGLEYARATTSHYVDDNGMIVHGDSSIGEIGLEWYNEYIATHSGYEPTRVTIYDAEVNANESRRKLKIVSKAVLNQILAIYEAS